MSLTYRLLHDCVVKFTICIMGNKFAEYEYTVTLRQTKKRKVASTKKNVLEESEFKATDDAKTVSDEMKEIWADKIIDGANGTI